MKPLGNDFDQVQRQRSVDDALATLDRFYFDRSAPSRIISGLALSTRNPNSKGIAFNAQGMTCRLPVPLVIDHDLDRPVGRVTWLEARGDELLFRAEVGNDMRIAHDIWMQIIIRTVTCVSVRASNVDDMTSDKTFERWRLDELSLTRSGADSGSIITRCAERDSVIYLDGRPSETVYWHTERYIHKPNETVYGNTP